MAYTNKKTAYITTTTTTTTLTNNHNVDDNTPTTNNITNTDTADDIKTVDEMHVEVDKLYHFKLEARDVLHSFSVQVFRLKQDAIPGRIITGWFTPNMTGEFDIQCAEICGIGHALMPGRLIVEEAAAHSAWVAEHTPLQVAALPARAGKD